MNYNLEEHKKWLEDNVKLSNAYSPDSLREMSHHILMGRNYRLITENNTKSKLLFHYLWLKDIVKNAKQEYGKKWKEGLMADLMSAKRKPTQNLLRLWLVGLTAKTATNVGVTSEDFPNVLSDLIKHFEHLLKSIDRDASEIDDAWLLMMAGSATLTVRGSDKSKIGKQVERVWSYQILTLTGK